MERAVRGEAWAGAGAKAEAKFGFDPKTGSFALEGPSVKSEHKE